MKKKCTKCRIIKELSEFHKRGNRKSSICRECTNYKLKLSRQQNCNSVTCKYEKTINGFLMRLYRNMQSRIDGVQWKKYHLYYGKELLDRESFYNWARKNNIFLELFNKWSDSNYSRKLTPSVDRIDSSKGYNLENMEWVTHSENSRRGAINKNIL